LEIHKLSSVELVTLAEVFVLTFRAT
jgi:hypothetical protein